MTTMNSENTHSTDTLADRLRGKYVIPVDDGAGLLDGKDTFTRQFVTPPIQHEAADRIDQLERKLAEVMEELRLVVGQRDWANKQLLARSETAPQSAAATDAGMSFCCAKDEASSDEIAKLRNVVSTIFAGADPWEAWNRIMDKKIERPASETAPSAERIAQLIAHRAVGNQEQDAQNGKLAGYCAVCQVPWPCEVAKPAASARSVSAPCVERRIVTGPDEYSSVYVYLTEQMTPANGVHHTKRHSASVDYGPDGKVLGIEILDVTDERPG